MTNLLTRYNPPLRAVVGPDGIPHYLSAQAGDPNRWTPPPGKQLHVYCNGVELYFVLECDRSRGWARTHGWEWVGGTVRMIDRRAEDGTPLVRLYHGEITYRVKPAKVPGWLRRLMARGGRA